LDTGRVEGDCERGTVGPTGPTKGNGGVHNNEADPVWANVR
jgi:hypothetical protein